MTTAIVIAIIVVIAVAAGLAYRSTSQKSKESAIARAEQLRESAQVDAHSDLPVAQSQLADAEAKAEVARELADQAEAEAQDARLQAGHIEAAREDQLREADRLDPRVDHRADDYEPQVPPAGAAAPTEVAEPTEHAEPAPTAESTEQTEHAETTEPGPGPATTGLPRRTPGGSEMPGQRLESDRGTWFRKDVEKDGEEPGPRT